MFHLAMAILLNGVLPGAAVSAEETTLGMTTETPQTFVPPGTLGIRDLNGLVNADINGSPLGHVLRELAGETGARFTLRDPTMATRPVSAIIKRQPFHLAVRRVLAGLSYVTHPSAGSRLPEVIVLAKPNTEPQTGAASNASLTIEGSSRARVAGTDGDRHAPQSLDEFRPIPIQEADPQGDGDGARDDDPESQDAKTQRYEELVLQRALDALQSDHAQLYTQAVDPLVASKDARATQALIQAAGRTDTKESRIQAVDALWRHASTLEFADDDTVNALKQLAGDNDQKIGEVAKRALEDMDKYLKNKE